MVHLEADDLSTALKTIGTSDEPFNRCSATTSATCTASPSRRGSRRGLDIAEWRYTFEPTPTGCRVTETWTDRRNRVLKTLSRRVTGVVDRAAHNRAGMEKTLERLAKAAESGATANT